MSAKVYLSIYGCLVFLTGEVRLPCGNNLLAIFISFQGFILVGFGSPKMTYSKHDQPRSPRKWKGIRSSIYGTSPHQKTLRKPFPRLTHSRRRPRSQKHPRRFPVFVKPWIPKPPKQRPLYPPDQRSRRSARVSRISTLICPVQALV